jgi:nicotinate-nucleotide adenylyltransferase
VSWIPLAIGCTVKKIAVLAGAFNPVTRAHLALAKAASGVVDEVLCVVPRVYPHKELEGASLEQRVEMLRRALGHYRVERTEGGLFIEIARELRLKEPDSEVHFVCGRDAAERILHWDYGEEGFAERMLEEFGLLVAARQGEFLVPQRFEGRVVALRLDGDFDEVSSTEVRRRIQLGEPWEHLVPPEIVDLVREVYR